MRLNKSRVEAIEAAGQPSKRAADDERQELVSENVNSKRLAELFIEPDGREATPYP